MLLLSVLIGLMTSFQLMTSCPMPSGLLERCFAQIYTNNSCIYLCPPNNYFDGRDLCTANGLSVVSIHKESENDLAKAVIDEHFAGEAFIGFVNNGTAWIWDDQSGANFDQLVNYPATSPGPHSATTIPPSLRHQGTSVTVLVDSSIYSTSADTMSELVFARKLASKISSLGYGEFAILYFGCNSHNNPARFATLEPFLTTLQTLKTTIVNTCLRTNPYTFAQAIDDVLWYYYSANSERRKAYTHEAVVIFSSITDPSTINVAPPIAALPNAPVVGVSVGNSALALSRFASSPNNLLRVANFSQMDNLVDQVYSLIVPETQQEDAQQFQQDKGLHDFAISNSAQMCSYLSTEDELWHPTDCYAERHIICQGPSEVPPTPLNPTRPAFENQLCSTPNFTSYRDLDNSKCYKVDDDLKTFSQALDVCEETPNRKTVTLTSVQSSEEMGKVSSLVSETSYGMFWIGLMRKSENDPWTWADGQPFDNTTYTNWRAGYPRPADGANCVAYVLNDDSWINTDCNKTLLPVCAYQFV